MRIKSRNLTRITLILSLVLLFQSSWALSQQTEQDPSEKTESNSNTVVSVRMIMPALEQLHFRGILPIKYSRVVGGVTLSEAKGLAIVLSTNPIVLVTHEKLLTGDLPGFLQGFLSETVPRENTEKIEIHVLKPRFLPDAMMGLGGPGGMSGMGMGGGYGGGMGMGVSGGMTGENPRLKIETREIARIVDPILETLRQGPSSGWMFIFAEHVVYDQTMAMGMGMGPGSTGMGGMGMSGAGIDFGDGGGSSKFGGEKEKLGAWRARLASTVSTPEEIWTWESGDYPTLHADHTNLPDAAVLIDSERRVAVRINSNTLSRSDILQEYLQVYNKLQKQAEVNGTALLEIEAKQQEIILKNQEAENRLLSAKDNLQSIQNEQSDLVVESQKLESPIRRPTPDRIVQSVIEFKSSQDPEERERAANQLRTLLEIEFDAHRSLKANELQSLKRRLEELEQVEQALIEQRDQTVQQRLNRLLDLSDERQ
jgi:hypothetical protein